MATNINEVKEVSQENCVACVILGKQNTNEKVYFCQQCFAEGKGKSMFCIQHGEENHKNAKLDHSFGPPLDITQSDLAKTEVNVTRYALKCLVVMD